MRLPVFFAFVLFLSTPFSSAADIDRRQALRGIAACVASLMTSGPSATAAPFSLPHHHRWSLHPGSDIETLGLESFGLAVREIMTTHKYAASGEAAEKLRWSLQETLWRRLEPKTDFSEPVLIKTQVAIRVSKGSYLYFSPSFRLSPYHPLSADDHGTEDRTVGKVEYVGEEKDSRALRYRIGGPPREPSTLVVGDHP